MGDCIPLLLKGNSYTPSKYSSDRFWKAGSSKYNAFIQEASMLYGVEVNLIKAIIRTESNFNSKALSKMGAQGLMQLMPATARELGVDDAFNARQNIMGGVHYFSKQLKAFDGSVKLSLAAYNAGPTLVRRLGRVPDIRETKNYIKKVLHHFQMYNGKA
ncbi:MAG: lytic transglycosylase domain-containing protein [Desulfotalea sp.]